MTDTALLLIQAVFTETLSVGIVTFNILKACILRNIEDA